MAENEDIQLLVCDNGTGMVKGPKQDGVMECRYYIMRYMRDIIVRPTTTISNVMQNAPRKYSQEDLDLVRSEWAEFVGSHLFVA